MTPPETTEETTRSLSTITGAGSPEEILDMLDKFGIEWIVSGEGDLIVKYWQVVAKSFIPRERIAIIRRRMSSACAQVSEIEWLSRNLDSLKAQYAGKWVAICNNRVAASAADLPQLMPLIGEFNEPFITQIPAEPIIWTMTYGLKKL